MSYVDIQTLRQRIREAVTEIVDGKLERPVVDVRITLNTAGTHHHVAVDVRGAATSSPPTTLEQDTQARGALLELDR